MGVASGGQWMGQVRFRGGLVFKAHRLLYHSTLGSRVIKKKKKRREGSGWGRCRVKGLGFRVQGLGSLTPRLRFWVQDLGSRVVGRAVDGAGAGLRVQGLGFRVWGL